ALETNGYTVAVLGCGIDRDYPAAHAGLARSIAERSLLVSEYEPGVEPAPWRFPARKGKTREAMRKAAFLCCCRCRRWRTLRCWCGPGVVATPRAGRSRAVTTMCRHPTSSREGGGRALTE